MKKAGLTIVLTLILALIVSACGSNGSNGANQGNGGSGASGGNTGGNAEQSREDDKVYVLKLGYENNPGEPVDLAAHRWQELAEERSGGRLKLELYPSSQLGSKSDLTEQMRSGANVATVSDGSFLADFVPDMGILMGPYLADDEQQMFKLFESEWFDGIRAQLEEQNVHVLSTNWLYGVRHVIAKQPATTPAEFAGVKLRAPNSDIFIKTVEAMGATPTPMPLGDVYPSITQGVIDGMENPLTVIYGSKTYEQAKHILLTGHMTNITNWIAGQPFIESLPDDLVAILKETGDEAGDFMTETVKQSDDDIIDMLKAEGVSFHEVDRAAFREAAKPVYEAFPQWTPGLYDTIQDILSEN